jgi:hypothetical protein
VGWRTAGERLRGVRAVGVAVDVDAADVQRVKHRRDVVDRVGGAVELPALAELECAAAGAGDIAADVLAERPAIERPGEAGAAQVDEQQVAPHPQWGEQVEVAVAAVGGGEPGAALDREHRAERGAPPLAAWIALELDPEPAGGRAAAVERDADRPAARAGGSVTARVVPDCGVRARRRGRDAREREDEQRARG